MHCSCIHCNVKRATGLSLLEIKRYSKLRSCKTWKNVKNLRKMLTSLWNSLTLGTIARLLAILIGNTSLLCQNGVYKWCTSLFSPKTSAIRSTLCIYPQYKVVYPPCGAWVSLRITTSSPGYPNQFPCWKCLLWRVELYPKGGYPSPNPNPKFPLIKPYFPQNPLPNIQEFPSPMLINLSQPTHVAEPWTKPQMDRPVCKPKQVCISIKVSTPAFCSLRKVAGSRSRDFSVWEAFHPLLTAHSSQDCPHLVYIELSWGIWGSS